MTRRARAQAVGSELGTGMLPVCLAAGGLFAAGTARLFLVPLHARAAGASTAEVGLLFTVMQLSAAAVSMPAGALGDRFGRRRVLAAAALLMAASQIAISRAGALPVELCLQALQGAGGSAGMATCLACALDRAGGRRAGPAVAWVGLANQVGYLAGPALAAGLLRWLPVDGALAVTALPALAVLVVLPGIEPGAPGSAARLPAAPVLAAFLRRREVMSLFLAMLAATLLLGTTEAYLPLFGKEHLRLSAPVVGALIALQAALSAAARYPAGRLSDRLARRPAPVFLLTTGYGAVLAAAPHLAGLAGGLLIAGGVTLLAFAFVLLGAGFASLVGEEARGAAMGVYTTAVFVGLSVGPAAFGPVVDRSGYGAGFAAAAVTAGGLSFLALYAIGRPSRSRTEP